MNRKHLKQFLQQSVTSAIDFTIKKEGFIKDEPYFYISGGTARRLYMLENDIPMTEYDFKAAVGGDIDVFIDDTTKNPLNGDINYVVDETVQLRLPNNITHVDKTVQHIYMNRYEFLEPFFDIDCCRFVIDPREPNKVICKYDYGEDFFKASICPEDITYASVMRMIKYSRFGFIFDEKDVMKFCELLNMDVYTLKTLYSETV